jgi:hypothetical protein
MTVSNILQEEVVSIISSDQPHISPKCAAMGLYKDIAINSNTY